MAERLGRPNSTPHTLVITCTDCSRFLLVRFHIEYLCQQTTVKQVLKALQTLKRGSSTESGQLDVAYGRALRNISSQSPSERDLAFKTLSWLVRARRPLTVEELRIAVSIEPGRYELDKWDLPAAEILIHVCAGLVTVDGNTIRLAHYSVQEYLVENALIFDDAGYNHAMACITYLSFETLLVQEPCTTRQAVWDRLQAHPFLDYAIQYIGFHLKECDERLSADMFLDFIENSRIISCWYQLLSYKRYPPLVASRSRCPLHIASLLGHFTVVRRLLNKGVDISTQDSDGSTALHHAVDRGHKEVAELLLENGANIAAGDDHGRTALQQAVFRGHGEIARLLLDRGADISSRDNGGETALHHAVDGGRKDMVRLLLDRGADITARDASGDTALQEAARRGHGEIVRLLLDNGADIAARNNKGETALRQAIRGGQKEVVELLLDKGADIATQNKYGNSALQGAASWGHGDIVRLLLDKGADITTQDSEGDTALHDAAFSGYREITKMLLDKGADTTTRNIYGGTALHLAALEGHKDVVELLLDKGAILSVLNKGQPALDVAHGHGQ